MDDIKIDNEQRITQEELLERLYSKNSLIDKIYEEELQRRMNNIKDIGGRNFSLKALNESK
jgi:hypothetical protein